MLFVTIQAYLSRALGYPFVQQRPQEVSTTADGEYVFRDLTTGNYTVTIVSLDGTGYALEGATLQNVYLAVNGSGSALFTVLPEASIVGKAEPGTDLTLNVGSANRGRSVATVRADSLGVYQFRGLQPGEYSLGITPPPGFTTVQGNIPVMMRGGSERANVEMLTNGTIRGVVFGDVDGNSVATFRENGVGGVMVRLLQNGVLFKESVTAADGSYQFSGLSEGVFAVEVVSTRFEQARVITTTLSTAVPGANLNVDMRQRAAISGRLYRNDTGVGMTTVSVNAVGLANFTVTLRNQAGIVSVMRSDVSGFYQFASLPAGEYEIEVHGAEGFTTVGGVDRRTIVLTAGSAQNGVNFGFQLGAPTLTMRTRFYMPILYLLSPTK